MITRSYYAGQPIGLVLADTFEHARAAAKAVVIQYTNMQPPLLAIPDALTKKNKAKYTTKVPIVPKAPVKMKASGTRT